MRRNLIVSCLGLVGALAASGCGSSNPTASNVQACLQKKHFTVVSKTPDATGRNLGETNQLEVTTEPGNLYFVDFWKDSKSAQFYAKGPTGNYKVFGKITVDDANSSGAKSIEQCLS